MNEALDELLAKVRENDGSYRLSEKQTTSYPWRPCCESK